MNKNAETLIDILRCYINSEPPELSDDTDFYSLFALAREHNLEGMLYCAINRAKNKDAVPADPAGKMKEDFFTCVYRSSKQDGVMNLIDGSFKKNNIKYVPFKGIILKNLFPVPESRVMSDIDLLISGAERADADRALKDAGFKCENSNGPVWDYTKSGVKLELHTSILNGKIGSSSAAEYFKDAFDIAKFNGVRGLLPDQYHFEYLIAHIAHHFWFYGAGIKMIADLAVMIQKKSIDCDKTVADLEKCGLGKFAKIIISITKKWFSQGTDYNIQTKDAEDFIVSHGAFGNSGRDFAAVYERKELEEGKSGRKVQSLVRLAFPPYSKMKEIPYIKFLDGRPYLTPYAWIIRAVYNLKNRKKLTKSALKKAGDKSTRKKAENEIKFLEEVGLL